MTAEKLEEITITTDRLILKGISPAVIHRVFNTMSEAGVKEFLGVEGKDYEHYRQMHEKGMENHRISMFFFLLVEKASGDAIGECGFHTWNNTHKRAELFYNLRNPVHRQKGYMGEVLGQVLEYGFTQMGLNRVEALVAANNTPSVRLLQKHGFTFEGTMREDYVVDGVSEDSDCYSLLKREWNEQMANIATNNMEKTVEA